ncbi:MAG: hypothetical protein JXA42_20945, partial [Anaerolineales bacterium]|nr:hypothetical protein [Anaerolineales bacterium]
MEGNSIYIYDRPIPAIGSTDNFGVELHDTQKNIITSHILSYSVIEEIVDKDENSNGETEHPCEPWPWCDDDG